MAYKRYIKKGGRIYGPYTYQSRKENGKVISEYMGKSKGSVKEKKSFSSKKFLIFGFCLLLAIFLIFFLHEFLPTGKATISLDRVHIAGEELKGNVKFNINEGELIPADSKILISLGDVSKEFLLSDLADSEIVEGNFYAENTYLLGYGEGYGIAGSKKIYPNVSFDMRIINEEEVSDENSELNKTGSEEIISKEETNETEITEQNETIIETPEQETVVEENDEEFSGEIVEEGQEETIAEENSEQPVEIIESPEVAEENTETQSESTAENSEISITGEVISESNIIFGIASKGNDFEYELEKGKSAEIISGSVKANGEIIDDDSVNVKNQNKKVIVSTDYSYEEKGFGSEFLGEDKLELNINFNELGFVVEKSTQLVVKIIYENQTIVEASRDVLVEIPEEEINETEFLNETVETNITEILNETIITNVTFENVSTIQYGAVVGKPVKWKKIISDDDGKVNVEIPKEAENITVYKLNDIDNPESSVTNESFELPAINETEENIINETISENVS